MRSLIETIAIWLADYYLLSTALLALTLVVLAAIRQPAQRRAVTQSMLVALFVLVILVLLPGWSALSLLKPRHAALPSPTSVDIGVAEPSAAESANPNVTTIVSQAARADFQQAAAPTSAEVPNFWPEVTWHVALVVVWGTGALCVLIWLAIGSLALRRLLQTTRDAGTDVQAVMRDVIHREGHNSRNVRLMVSGQVDVAVAVGLRGPIIVLPESWTTDYLPLKLRSVLAHEVAHVQNSDLRWLAASRAMLVLLWAQPLYWLLRRRMRLDQEALADAAAAELTSRQCYAEELVAWARHVAARPALRLSSAIGLWEKPSELRQRISLLLDRRIILLRKCSRPWRVISLGLCIMASLALSLMTLEPRSSSQSRAESTAENADSKTDERTVKSNGAAVEAKPRRFVRLVTGPKGELTFEGEPITWDNVASRLEQIPKRSETVLEFAISSRDISVRELEESQSRAMSYARQFNFLYGSYIGVHPLDSKGTRVDAGLPANDESAKATKDADEEQGSQMLRDIRAKSAPILAAMAKEHGYGLPTGKDLLRVAPPFPDIRMEYYRTGHPTQSEHIPAGPSVMVFRWEDGRLQNWGMTFGDPVDGGYDLTDVLDALADIKSQQIEGPRELLTTRLPGDWVIRKGAAADDIVKQLQAILQIEFSLPIKLEFREVERPVYVARGEYEFTPLAGQPGKGKLILTDETITTDEIQIFGRELVPNSGAGGGTDHFDEFLNWLGRWIGTPIVSEVERKPTNQLSWHLHERSPSTDDTRDEDHDPNLVLPNITAQTSLAFTLEERPVRILFVERTTPATP